jgi:hypothetical protein
VDLKDVYRDTRDNEVLRNMMLINLGVDEVTFFLYNFSVAKDYRGSIIDFMNEAVKQSYIEVGWEFGRYYNQKLNEYHALITDPSRARSRPNSLRFIPPLKRVGFAQNFNNSCDLLKIHTRSGVALA